MIQYAVSRVFPVILTNIYRYPRNCNNNNRSFPIITIDLINTTVLSHTRRMSLGSPPLPVGLLSSHRNNNPHTRICTHTRSHTPMLNERNLHSQVNKTCPQEENVHCAKTTLRKRWICSHDSGFTARLLCCHLCSIRSLQSVSFVCAHLSSSNVIHTEFH